MLYTHVDDLLLNIQENDQFYLKFYAHFSLVLERMGKRHLL